MHFLDVVLVIIKLHIPLCLVDAVHLVNEVDELLVNDSQYDAFVLETQPLEPVFCVL